MPERIVRWPALAASNAMSAPECERPTTRTAPGRSWAGLRYSCECSCAIDGSRSMAKSGTFICRNGPVATMTWRRSEALAVRGRHDEAAVDRLDAIDARPTPDRQVEPSGVRLEVVGHLATGRPVGRRRREAHARQRVVAGRAVELERVPAVPPVVADPRIGVEDHEWHASLGEVVAGRQARLSGPDDDRVDLLRVLSVHRRPPCRSVVRGSEATGSPGRHDGTLSVVGSGAHRRYYPNGASDRMGTSVRRGRARTRRPSPRRGWTRRAS